MIKIQKGLVSYLDEAKEYLKKGRVQEIEFSGSTYQIRVIDPKYPEGVWAFLQFGFKDQLTDHFCSCDEHDEGCVHVLAACLKIYNHHEEPLHIRYNNSFWNHLLQVQAEHWAGNPHVFEPHEEIYQTINNEIRITPLNTKGDLFLGNTLNKKSDETEETSIKFSNLPQEEIELWREGRPSAALQYELSFWSDLAKWMMEQQEEGLPYEVDFSNGGPTLPNKLMITFQSLKIEIALKREDWFSLIPSLETIECSLKVFTEEKRSIFYYKEKGILELKGEESSRRKGLDIYHEGWRYLPNKGFYPETPIHFTHLHAEGMKIGEALNRNTNFIQSHLKNCSLHDYASFLSYQIDFNSNWDLVITAYLFEPGDLLTPFSKMYGDWAYLEDDGFYRLEGKLFTEIQTIIKEKDVADFVLSNRAFLNIQEGFQPHISHLEAQLTYSLTPEGTLEIHHLLDLEEKSSLFHDFGDWVYIKNEGFYETQNPLSRTHVYPGKIVNRNGLSQFIKKNEEELSHIPHFFSKTNPVNRFALDIIFNEDQTIQITPTYLFNPEINKQKLILIDDYVYIPDEGFSKMPIDLKIPAKYHKPCKIIKAELYTFIEQVLPLLTPFSNQLSRELTCPKKIKPCIQELSGIRGKEGFYTLKLDYKTDFGAISAYDLWKKIKEGIPFWPSEKGLLYVKNTHYEWLRQLPRSQFKEPHFDLVITPWDLIKLHILEEPTPPQNDKLYQEILGEPKFKQPKIDQLNANLRPYQKIGVQWLWHLYQHHLSGILADDMGLGKTLQAIALMCAITNHKKTKKKRRFIIVCPNSVLYHWMDKIALFFPDLKVYTHWGSNRDIKNFTSEFSVLLTSYGTLRSDVKILSKIHFTLAIFDEVQVAKNYTSLLYQSLKQIKAKFRLGLTGTPIENTIRELKAIFDLLLPGYMPKDSTFRELYLKPIEKENNHIRRYLLSKLISPFILRRKKEEVLKDLPEKIEEIAHCPLLPEQKELYESLVNQEKSHLLKENKFSYIHVFALLTKLKQICNHPACYLKTPESYQKYTSGKFELFKELLNEALGSNQKVVIFSQFLHMLDIIELYLNSLNIPFATIRGATRERNKEIERFQNDPKCKVFLGSLHAAGLGIDLTAANVVIHYDRWWNAAKEDQATDRVHRIGQRYGVQVFKLVTLHSLEEKIDALIEKKGRLLQQVIGTDDENILKKFSKDELLSLLHRD